MNIMPAMMCQARASHRNHDTDRVARKPWSLALLVAANSLYVAMRLWGMTQYPLDGDEIFSLEAARQSYADLLTTAARDISHPPLFYLLLKLWMTVGGQSLLWLRLLPVALSIATLAPIHLSCRTLKLRPREEALAVTLLAVNSFLLFYTQYLRMFVLLEFWAAWSLWAFVTLATQPKLKVREWLGVFLINLGLVYSHYWGWLVLGAEFLALLVLARDKLLPVLGVGAGLLVAYVPWVWTLVRVVTTTGTATQQIRWIAKPTWHDLLWFYASLNGTLRVPRGTLLSLGLFGLPVLLLAIRWARTRSQRNAEDTRFFVTMAALATLPVAVTFVASHVLSQSVWAERQLMTVALPYALLVAVAACRLQTTWARIVLPLVIAVWAVVAGLHDKTVVQKLAWDQLVQGIQAAEPQAEPPLVVYATEGFIAVPLAFHANDRQAKRLDVKIDSALDHLPDQHCWVAYRDRTWQEPASPQAKLLAAQFRVGESISIHNHGQTITAFPVWK
jgi:uncharacterized membrane protein